MLFIIRELFVDGAGCANVSSTMLWFAKKLANYIDNDGDSIVIINTNPMNITAKL